jgi:hypothetical protein
MHAFGLETENRFIQTMVQRLAVDFPLHFEVLGNPGLTRAVREALDWGPKIGIRTTGAMGVLAELVLVYGPELRDSPDRAWGLEILAHPSMPGELKLRLLRNRMEAKSHGRLIVKQSG